jgi:hypothetical protein
MIHMGFVDKTRKKPAHLVVYDHLPAKKMPLEGRHVIFFSQQFWEISLRCRISTKSHIWAWAGCYLTRSQPAMVPVVVPVEARVEPGKSGQWVTFTLRTSKTMGWLVVSTTPKNMSSSVGIMNFPIYGKS